jgi:hypothetical protein
VTQSELPDDVRRLVHECVPTLDALEILLLLARDPGREWQPHAVLRLLQPGTVRETDVLQYLELLVARGILVRRPDGAFAYEPRQPALTRAIEGVIIAYHQRPVTLVRTVYAGAALRNIQTFADAFRLRNED